jgi:benzoyl-CoA reductase/2-hydroxyglutaryl-CoA dehydratase subunit BcrC/BadD/HgdB
MTRPEIAATNRLREVMDAHYRSVAGAASERARPVAWCTSVGPAELLRALGFELFFPENHGAMLGATRAANRVMPRAHAAGYSQDICSYLTSDIGAYLSGETPLERYGMKSVPRADVLVFNTNQCRDVRDWFEFYGREWRAPVVGVTAMRGLERVSEEDVDAIERQLESLVEPLEQIAGTKLDSDRLRKAVERSRECSTLWRACLETAAHRPAPWTFFDATVHMGPAVVLRGTSEACDYYRALLSELERRCEQGVAAVPDERHRLYWDGMPIWGRLRSLSTQLAELRTAVVASTYCNSWIFDCLDPDSPFRSLARASLELFICRSEGPKQRLIEEMARRYSVDGVLFHDSRTCPNNSNTRYGMPRRLQAETGVPTLVIEGDLNDLRCFSDEQSRTSIEGFVEQLEEPRAAGRAEAD